MTFSVEMTDKTWVNDLYNEVLSWFNEKKIERIVSIQIEKYCNNSSSLRLEMLLWVRCILQIIQFIVFILDSIGVYLLIWAKAMNQIPQKILCWIACILSGINRAHHTKIQLMQINSTICRNFIFLFKNVLKVHQQKCVTRHAILVFKHRVKIHRQPTNRRNGSLGTHDLGTFEWVINFQKKSEWEKIRWKRCNFLRNLCICLDVEINA